MPRLFQIARATAREFFRDQCTLRAVVAWRSVWVGGIVTAVLLELGKCVIGFYLGHSNPGNAFGGASALAVILVWIYYSGMLVLFGAEFTQAVAMSLGHSIEPKHGAIRVVREEHTSSESSPRSSVPARR